MTLFEVVNEKEKLLTKEELARIKNMVERGGPGSGHKGHKGRPGEVGGSLPSGSGTNGKKKIDIGGGYVAYVTNRPADPMSVNDFQFVLSEFDEWMETHPDIYIDPKKIREKLDKTLMTALQRAIIDFAEETGHIPRDLIFTDDPQVIMDEYYSGYEMTEAQMAQTRKEVMWGLYNGVKASFIGLEEYPDNKKIIHLNVNVQPNEYTLKMEFQGDAERKISPTEVKKFDESVQHELGHWLALEARVRNVYSDPDNPTRNDFSASDEWKHDNRFYDPSMWAHEYQADLIASMVIGDMGFRSRNRALTERESADRDRLMALIDERMAAKEQEVVKSRSAPRPVIALIPWGDGTFEALLITEDDLPEEERGKGVISVVYRGGPGSGHAGHEGRPGEVGGSLPSGAAGAAAEGRISTPRSYKSKEFGDRLEAAIKSYEDTFTNISDRVLLITDNVDDAVKTVLDRDKARDFELGDDDEDRAWYEKKWSDEYYQDQYNKLKGKIEGRLSGGTIGAGAHEAVIYVSEDLTVGEFHYKNYRGEEKTIVSKPDEPEYVITHELAHAFIGESRDTYRELRSAHLDVLREPKYEHRMEEIMIPRSYRAVMAKFYPEDLNGMENEFYADMLSYGIRLENNPDEKRIMVGGERGLTTDEWLETDENPQELARALLTAAREYVSKQKETGDDGQ